MTQASISTVPHRPPRTMKQVDSPAETSAPILGAEAESIITCNQKLKELGIDGTIKLPQICVIGDQSTGKSSLIESLSTIKVPKAKGVCTQCPIAINLTSGKSKYAPWTCVISIEERYSYSFDSAKKKVTKSNPMGPWQRRDQMIVTEMGCTDDKEALPNLIGEAQARILTPKPEGRSNTNTNIDAVSTKFSPNVIRLDISEGEWPNLSFVDLPGVFSATDSKAENYLVQLVDNLAKHYASDENVVSMLTLPMNHDTANSKAYSLIQDVEAHSRTLAVYTKTDLAHPEQRNQVIDKIKNPGKSQDFDHGYHIVMMPDSSEVVDEVRDVEADFFNTSPWADLPSHLKKRLGIPSLNRYLRNLLFAKTAESLPENLQNIRQRMNQVDVELQGLPDSPNVMELPWKLQQSVVEFHTHINRLFTGEYGNGEDQSRRMLNELVSGFRNQINDARPALVTSTKLEHDEFVRLKKRRDLGGTVTDPVTVESEDETPTMRVKNETVRSNKTLGASEKMKLRLEDIRQKNLDFYKAFVPAGIELQAVDQLNKDSVRFWEEYLGCFMNKVSALVNEEVLKCVDSVFRIYNHLELFGIIRSCIKTYLDHVIQEEWGALEILCLIEKKCPVTINTDMLKKEEDEFLNRRRELRATFRMKLFEEQQASLPTGKKKKIDKSSLPADEYDTEVQMSAKTSAYYKVAAARFVDNVYMTVIGRLLPRCRDNLLDHLRDHLGLLDVSRHEQIALWMAENPQREAHRRKLRHELRQLAEGHKYIEDVLGNRSDSDDQSDITVNPFDKESGMLSPPNLRGRAEVKRKTSDNNEYDSLQTPPSKKSRVVPRAVGETAQRNGPDSAPVTPTPARKLRQRLESVSLTN